MCQCTTVFLAKRFCSNWLETRAGSIQNTYRIPEKTRCTWLAHMHLFTKYRERKRLSRALRTASRQKREDGNNSTVSYSKIASFFRFLQQNIISKALLHSCFPRKRRWLHWYRVKIELIQAVVFIPKPMLHAPTTSWRAFQIYVLAQFKPYYTCCILRIQFHIKQQVINKICLYVKCLKLFTNLWNLNGWS